MCRIHVKNPALEDFCHHTAKYYDYRTQSCSFRKSVIFLTTQYFLNLIFYENKCFFLLTTKKYDVEKFIILFLDFKLSFYVKKLRFCEIWEFFWQKFVFFMRKTEFWKICIKRLQFAKVDTLTKQTNKNKNTVQYYKTCFKKLSIWKSRYFTTKSTNA